jgi:hypothetical protein
MKIYRRPSRKDLADTDTVAAEQEPEVTWTEVDGGLSLQVFYNPLPRNPGEQYHYEVCLSVADIVAIVRKLSIEGIQRVPDKVQSALQGEAVHLVRLLGCAFGNVPRPAQPDRG